MHWDRGTSPSPIYILYVYRLIFNGNTLRVWSSRVSLTRLTDRISPFVTDSIVVQTPTQTSSFFFFYFYGILLTHICVIEIHLPKPAQSWQKSGFNYAVNWIRIRHYVAEYEKPCPPTLRSAVFSQHDVSWLVIYTYLFIQLVRH